MRTSHPFHEVGGISTKRRTIVVLTFFVEIWARNVLFLVLFNAIFWFFPFCFLLFSLQLRRVHERFRTTPAPPRAALQSRVPCAVRRQMVEDQSDVSHLPLRCFISLGHEGPIGIEVARSLSRRPHQEVFLSIKLTFFTTSGYKSVKCSPWFFSFIFENHYG